MTTNGEIEAIVNRTFKVRHIAVNAKVLFQAMVIEAIFRK